MKTSNCRSRTLAGCIAALIATSAFVTVGGIGTAGAQSVDPVVFSFATVGDNRQDPKKADPTTFVANPSPTTQNGGPSLSGAVLPQDQVYMQNSAAWDVIQQGILSQGAQLLFFNGDMIFGYGRPIMPAAWTGNPVTWKTPVTSTVYPDAFFEFIQYAYWRGTVSTMFSSGTYVIPVAGNHETQCSSTASPYGSGTAANPNCSTTINGGKQAYAENENMFRANTADLIQDLVGNLRFSAVSGVFATNVTGLTAASTPGPTGTSTPCTTPGATNSTCTYTAGTPANNGPISGTQQELDYSFDVVVPKTQLMLHFAIVNTDPSGADATPPADWLAGDFAAAAARGTAGNTSGPLTVKYFVFGHKAAFTYDYVPGGSVAPGATNPGPGGLDANTVLTYRNLFWHTIAQYNATYFCGHEHVPNVQQFADPTPGTTLTNTPYQVIVGSGGSPFDDTMSGSSPNYTEPPEAAMTDRYYAWANVQVHKSGAVTLALTGFPDTGIGGGVYDLQNYDVPGAVFTGTLQ